jgi:hypothetical protein
MRPTLLDMFDREYRPIPSIRPDVGAADALEGADAVGTGAGGDRGHEGGGPRADAPRAEVDGPRTGAERRQDGEDQNAG